MYIYEGVRINPNVSYSGFQMLIFFLRKIEKIVSVFRIQYFYVVLKLLVDFGIVNITHSHFLY